MGESIKARLAAGQPVHILNIGAVPSPKVIEIAAASGGYHGVWIDQEHAALTQAQIEILVLACRSVGLDSYVRLAPTDYATVMRPMETGAGGIMAAQIRTVEEVRQLVRWAKFPPLGHRGLNLSNFEGGYTTRAPAEFVASANRDRWLSVQIETAEALEGAGDIARVEGIDHLFVGPADLSLALGVPGEYLHPRCVAALEKVAQAAQDAGKTWGILARGAEHAELCRRLGCLLFAFASDLSVLQLGFRQTKALYRAFLEESKPLP